MKERSILDLLPPMPLPLLVHYWSSCHGFLPWSFYFFSTYGSHWVILSSHSLACPSVFTTHPHIYPCGTILVHLHPAAGGNIQVSQEERAKLGRVFLMLNYTDLTQNTYIQSWTVTEIMAREVWNFDSCYTLTDYQIHIKTGRNMWFL